MIKTTYQTPELRDSNDNIVQEGAFGKNTALSNSANDGWIDYVVNNLEALHDTIGDSAATLDGNGHVVEPANLAIGDEDGNRLKTSYLKLTGGTVSGTLNVAQNLKFQDNQENVFGGVYIPSSSATEQYAQFYGGESTGVAGAKLTLYPDGDGRFKLEARSTDGANTYTLVTDNNGNLNWRGYPLAWKKDYLSLAGGTMTGGITSTTADFLKRNTDSGTIRIMGGSSTNGGAFLLLYGKDYSTPGRFTIRATDGTNFKDLQGRPDGSLSWGGNVIALLKDVLPKAGGTMTGNISFSATEGRIQKDNANHDGLTSIYGSNAYQNGAYLMIYGKNHASYGGCFRLTARDDTDGAKELQGRPDGTLTWNGNDLSPQKETGYYPSAISVPSGTTTELQSFSITKGTWLVCYNADFASNATGYRTVRISASSTGSGANRAEVRTPAASGVTTRIGGSVILRVGSTTTYYLNAQQNSGSALNVTGAVQIFRLSTVS